MLRTLSARHDRFALNAPFRISRGVKTAADVVTVTVAGAGHVGRGEGVPYPRYGETVEAALAAIEQARALIERGGSRADLAGAMPAGAARNAVDNALWDWEARAFPPLPRSLPRSPWRSIIPTRWRRSRPAMPTRRC
jgi:L-alanine-DL-glutamate epimerase-like enolase superfamily enzyme